MDTIHYEKDVCIVGAGPAGMFLGLLLAKQGVDVIVLESHDDFAREYRGEVLQPRFIQLLNQLGLRDYLESFPHAKLLEGAIYYRHKRVGAFEFSAFAEEARYALWMSQPVMLQALFEKASRYPSFSMKFSSPVKHLLKEGDRIIGVSGQCDGQSFEVRAKVTKSAQTGASPPSNGWAASRTRSIITRATLLGLRFRGRKVGRSSFRFSSATVTAMSCCPNIPISYRSALP